MPDKKKSISDKVISHITDRLADPKNKSKLSDFARSVKKRNKILDSFNNGYNNK